MPYIYKITNDINNKIYIGKTSTTVEQRWNEHKADFNCQSKQHRPLYSAMRKYGLEHFSISQIEVIDTDDIACEREIFWIEHYGSFKNGYNATKGGDGRCYADYDLIHNLFNEGKTGKEICEITGYTDKTITNALISAGVSKEDRVQRGHTQSQSVLMLDKDTSEILQIFSSLNEAERFLGKSGGRRHISEVCRGKRKTAYGYKWKF